MMDETGCSNYLDDRGEGETFEHFYKESGFEHSLQRDSNHGMR